VSIVGNRISNTTGPAAIVGGFQNWYKEGPIAANTRVRDNSISRVGLAPFFQRFNLRGAISIGTGTTEISEVLDTKNFRAHWGIAVVRNTIQSSVTPGIQVHDTHTAWIRENTIVGSSLNERLVSVPISVNNSCNVQVRENLVDGEAGMSDESCP
jgi:hypothetical protein